MSSTHRTLLVLLPIASLALASCGTLKQTGTGTAKVLKKSTLTVTHGVSTGIAALVPGPKIKIVEPREQDMQDFHSGTELAQAHRGQRSGGMFSNFWLFSEKLYFEEPDFSDAGIDNSLLPPPPAP